jgi:hypothetical protein
VSFADPIGTTLDTAAARAYAAFCEALKGALPPLAPTWDKLPPHLREAWRAAAGAAQLAAIK